MPPDLPTPTELDDGIREVADIITRVNNQLRARLVEVELKCTRLEDEVIQVRDRLDYVERQQPC